MPFSFPSPPSHGPLRPLQNWAGASVLALGLLSPLGVCADLLPDLSLRPVNQPSKESLPSGPNLGGIANWQTSPYKGAAAKVDFIPNYGYEGEWLYLDASRVGLQFKTPAPDVFGGAGTQSFRLFLAHQFEGFPVLGAPPPALLHLTMRHSGTDAGAAWRLTSEQNQTALELQARQDVSQTSRGSSVQLSLQHNTALGPVVFTPGVALSWRSADLNRYYYGVSAQEASPAMAAYNPGAGLNASLGLRAQTWLTDHWQLMGGVAATAFSSGMADSPIVQKHGIGSVYLGMAYDFEADAHPAYTTADSVLTALLKPDSLKISGGASTASGCSLVGIATLTCLNLNHKVFTSMVGVQWGRRVIKDWNDWPVDLYADIGVDVHLEHGQQTDAAQVEALVKLMYHSFPWDPYVHTRLGLGIGPSNASRPLFAEWDPKKPNAPRSHLMNYMEPSVDVSVGDILGLDDWRQTYLGFGVSHRSGIFKSARLLGNVDGGSNYVTVYLERAFN